MTYKLKQDGSAGRYLVLNTQTGAIVSAWNTALAAGKVISDLNRNKKLGESRSNRSNLLRLRGAAKGSEGSRWLVRGTG